MKTILSSTILCLLLGATTLFSQELYTGVWRAGSDGYFLWSGVEWDNFNNKWKELSDKGYRLTDIETFLRGNKRLYSGVWRSGTDGHYLWAGVDWNNFNNKWKELSNHNLRLIDLETYVEGGQRKYIGVWRQGNDGHFLWAGVEWDNFNNKWKELSNQNLRLIDFETYLDGNVRKYAGVWRQGNDGHFLWAGVDWNNFNNKWKELSNQNLRLIDLETYVEGGQRKYIGVWRQGNDGHFLWAGVEWDNFNNKWKELSNQNLRLIDFETYLDGNVRKYAGVWRQGNDGHFLWAGVDWNNFNNKWKELSNQNLRLIDIETWEEGGQRKYAGVWRQGNDGHFLWSGVDWENFTSKWAENGQNNLRLEDIEIYDSPCEAKCLNRALMADNPGTRWRDGYDYGIPATGRHCEGQGACPSKPSGNVIYRWPNLPIGSEFYLRTAVLYDAKDQIFTLPFKKGQSMSKNGWMYGPGNWHHALDYSRTDGKSFEVCAAAPGKVIFIGWDNWSGNTMILSHDVGNKKDVYRTIYMHLRNGPLTDCEAAWSKTMPTLDGDNKTNYKAYLAATGCPEKKADRDPAAAQWGTNSQTLDRSLLGKTLKAGDVLGWAGDTGPGGCGCTGGGKGPNTHLHLFFAHRNPSDQRWYFFEPYGIYGTPDCYPAAVDGAINTACSRYPVSWKGGKPQYTN